MSSVLYDAIRTGDTTMVSHLIQSGVNINTVLPDGRAPLNAAIAMGNNDVVSVIIAADPKLDVMDSFRVDSTRSQPIHYAAGGGRLDLVQQLIMLGVDVDEEDESGCTPLHHAATHGHLDVLKYLLEEEAEIDWESNSGRTALWKAVRGAHTELVQHLVTAGCSINHTNKVGESVLFECICHDHLLPQAGYLIGRGVDVNIRDIEGNTALHSVASLGKVEFCRLLIAGGVDVEARNDYKNTALHNACMQNWVEIAVLLLNHSTIPVSFNLAGQSPLYVAMLHQKIDATRLLFNNGVKLTKEERATFIKNEAFKNERKALFWRWCQEFFGTPRTLGCMCQSVVRQFVNACGRTTHVSVKQLPIPGQIQMDILLGEYCSSNVKLKI